METISPVPTTLPLDINIMGVVCGDFEGRYYEVNDTFLRMVGYNRDELLSDQITWQHLTPPEYLHLDLKAQQELMATGQCTPYEKQYLHKDGHRIDVLITGQLVQGAPDRFICYIIDISRQKQLERDLKQTESRYRRIVKGSNDGIWEWDLETGDLFWNDRLFSMMGLTSDSYRPSASSFRERIHPEDFEATWALVQEHFKNPSVKFKAECRLRHADGNYIHTYSRGEAERNREGKPIRFSGVTTDVTAIKQAELAIAENEERYKLVVVASNDGLWDTDYVNNTAYYNDRFYEIMGLSREEYPILTREFLWTMVHPEDKERTKNAFESHIRDKAPYDVESRVRHSSGAYIHVHARAQGVWDELGNLVRVAGSMTDITERKRAEEALQQSLARESLLRRIVEIANQSSDISQILNLVAEEIGRFFQADRSMVIRFTVQNQTCQFLLAGQFCLSPDILSVTEDDLSQLTTLIPDLSRDELGKQNEQPLNISLKQGYLDYLRDSISTYGGSQTFPHAHALYHLMERLVDKYQVQSIMRVGLFYRGNVYGSISLHQCRSERVWTDEEMKLLRHVATQVGEVIFQAELAAQERNAQRQVIEAEERYRLILEGTKDGIWDWDLTTGSVYWSDRFYEIIGLNRDTFIASAEAGWELIHPDDRERAEQVMRDNMHSGQPYEMEYRHWHASGRYIHILAHAKALLDDQGQPIRLLGIISDITERKITEEALKESEERFRSMAEASPLMVWLIDSQGNHSYVNQQCLDFLGLPYDNMISLGWQPFIHPEDFNHVASNLIQALNSKTRYKAEFRGKRHDGEYRWLLATGNPYGDGLVGSTVDITDIRQAKELAELANQRKSQFLANMSHELRTPLNAIIGYSDMLRSGLAGPLNEKQVHYISNVATSGKHLLTMVNQILDRSKIEAGKIMLEPELIRIADLMTDIQSVFRLFAEQKQVLLHYTSNPSLDTVEADPVRLKQILLNLVNNAIKFNRKGGSVTIESGPSDDRQWAILRVSDTGIGIPDEQLSQVFSEFFQVDPSFSRAHEGTGLGLAVTKRLVELHGGSIEVESEINVGSTFTIYLPIRSPLVKSSSLLPESVVNNG